MLPIPTRRLSDGRSIPVLGFGTYPMDDAEAETAVATALDLGYRLIDTASLYGNEVGVGRGIARSGVDRSEIFVTTKLRGADHGFNEAIAGLHGSLARLDLDYVDLYLIHWPLPRVNKYVDSWRAMIHLRDEGLIRSIGVSNFNEDHLERLQHETGELPSVNQIELHPAWAQPHLREVDARHDIVTESWSPLGRSLPLESYLPIAQSAKRHAQDARPKLCFAGIFNSARCPFPKRPPLSTNERTSMSSVSNSPARRWPRLPPSIKSRMDEDPEVLEEF